MRGTFEPLRWEHLTIDEKKKILESHMFLQEKRDGKIKGRTVAGGNKQRGFISKEEASSPTVATESVILTSVIDAIEGRDVAIVDISNAFIQIRIRGVLVDMLIDIAPVTYKPFVTINNKGEKVVLVRCHNATYGTMVASLQFYRKFTNSLLRKGFVLNQYDP
jgi:Reverse transcriptase (RNA-dependent DNA polymerase)